MHYTDEVRRFWYIGNLIFHNKFLECMGGGGACYKGRISDGTGGGGRRALKAGYMMEPQLTGKTGHQLTQLFLTVKLFCTHVLGVEETLTCWSAKTVNLSSVNRPSVLGHLEAGWKQRDVAILFAVSPSTITKLRLRYRDTHAVKDRPRSGKPRITADRVDRSIRLATLRNRRITARSL